MSARDAVLHDIHRTEPHSLFPRLTATRRLSSELALPLSDEDQVVQANDDASPTKWHLAHTTWFFEAFVLKPFLEGYRIFDERFGRRGARRSRACRCGTRAALRAWP